MSDIETRLRACAFCPNTCRSAYPDDEAVLPESHTASALAMVALVALHNGTHDAAVAEHLRRNRTMALRTRAACTYGVDVIALLDEALAQWPQGLM